MIENISRAIIIKEDRILLARQIGSDYTFLPGGHIEFGETAEEALHREMYEELGISGKCGKFICTVENIFSDAKGKKCHEIALYYLYHPEIKNANDSFESKEPHLEFFWADIEELENLNIKPEILDRLIQKLSLNRKPDRFYSVLEQKIKLLSE